MDLFLGLSSEGFGITMVPAGERAPRDTNIHAHAFTVTFRDLVRLEVKDSVLFGLSVEYRIRNDRVSRRPLTATANFSAPTIPASEYHVAQIEALFAHVREHAGERALVYGPLALPVVPREPCEPPTSHVVEAGPFRSSGALGDDIVAHQRVSGTTRFFAGDGDAVELWVTREYLYLGTKAGRAFRLPLTALRLRWNELGGWPYYVFGRCDAVVVPFPEGSPVRLALDAAVAALGTEVETIAAMPEGPSLATCQVGSLTSLLLWSASTAERPYRYAPRRYGISGAHLYVERRDGSVLKARLIDLKERRGEPNGDAIYVFGPIEVLVACEAGCAVRAALDARLAQ